MTENFHAQKISWFSRSLSRPPGLTWQPLTEDASAVLAARIEKRSVHPLLEEVALLQLRLHAGRGHGRVLGEVRGVLPLEELHAVLRVRLATEVAIRGRNLMTGPTPPCGPAFPINFRRLWYACIDADSGDQLLIEKRLTRSIRMAL